MIKFISNLKRRYFYSKLISKNDLCFDIGANIGTKSKLFLSLGANVIAFESQHLCVNSLEKIKKSYKKFEYNQIAVGAENKYEELHLANHIEVATLSNQFFNFYTSEKIQWKGKEIVAVKTLNSIIEEFGIPYYCKIDTEGFEFNILSSLSYEIPIIEFEFTEGFFEETLRIIELFKSNTFQFNLILNENPKFYLKKWVSAEELLKIFSNIPKKELHGNIFIKTNAN
jgi:FkbM family methyltransferase